MALPTCPKCRQSVLDDDAEFCPFCGASMSGKGPSQAPPAPQRPSAKPSPAPVSSPTQRSPAADSPVSGQPSSPSPSSTSRNPRPTATRAASTAVPAADDPFSVQSDVSRAIPVSPQRNARFTEPITCPMCDTKGFIPQQAFGRDVRCRNPECLAPVFTPPRKTPAAPRDSSTSNPPATRRRSRSGVPLPLVLSISALVLIVAGGVSWFLFLKPPAPQVSTTPPSPSRATDTAPSNPPSTPVEPEKPATPEPLPVVERPAEQAIAPLVAAAGREEHNRSKPYAVRLAAFALALQGDHSAALEQIERMKKFSGSPAHYQIDPLTRLAWNALEKGDTEQAKTYLATARETLDSLGSKGRDQLDLTIRMAPLLIALDDLPTAEQLLDSHFDKTSAGQVSTAVLLSRIAGTFDIYHWLPGTLPGGWEEPQRVATAASLVVMGRTDAALKWAGSLKTPSQRLEALLTLVETPWILAPTTTTEDLLKPCQSFVDQLPPGGRALIQFRLGLIALHQGNQELARKHLQSGSTLLAQIPEPKPVKFTNYDEFLEIPVPDLSEARIQAFAAAESARLSSRLGEIEPAFVSLTLAHQYLRGQAFSHDQILAIEGKINTLGNTGFQRELKRLYSLKTDDAARRKSSEIVRRITAWKPVADRRFELQFAILASVDQPELNKRVAAEIASRAASSDEDVREKFEDGSLALQLAHRDGLIGPGELGYYLVQDLASTRSQLLWTSRQEWASLAGQNKEDAAASILARVEKVEDAEYWLTWELNRLVARKQAPAAFRIVAQVSNIIHREEFTRLVSAQAVVTGQSAAAWEVAESPIIVPTVKVAAYTGILEGARKRTLPVATAP